MPSGTRDHEVAALGAGAVGALAGPAVAGALVRMAVEVEQRRHARVDDEDDVAAAAAVAAVGAAERLELLAVDRGAAVAAVAGGGVQHARSTKVAAMPRRACRPRCRRVAAAASAGGDVDDVATAPAAELHRAGDQSEQRVVAAAADVVAGVEVGAALADEDLAGVDLLAAEPLHAEALGVGVAAVAAGGRTLLVCHGGSYFPVSMPVTRSVVRRERWP